MPTSTVFNDIIESSGRRDFKRGDKKAELVRLMNDAQLLLDLEVFEYRKNKAVLPIPIYEGQWHVKTQKNIAILDGKIIKSDGSWSRLLFDRYTRDDIIALYGEEPNNIVSHTGTIAINATGDVTGTNTVIDDDGVVADTLMLLPNTSGGLYLLIDTVTDNTNWTVTEANGDAYSSGVLTGQVFYVYGTGATRGIPLYCAPDIIRIAPGSPIIPLSQGTENLVGTDCTTYEGLILYPPANADYTLSLTGYWLSAELVYNSSTDTETFWTTTAHRQLLKYKVLWLLEGDHRNTTGQRDREEMLKGMMKDIRRNYFVNKSENLGSQQKRVSMY